MQTTVMPIVCHLNFIILNQNIVFSLQLITMQDPNQPVPVIKPSAGNLNNPDNNIKKSKHSKGDIKISFIPYHYLFWHHYLPYL